MRQGFYTKLSGIFVMLVFMLLATGAAFANTGKLSGIVTDKATGEPIPGVNVSLLGTQLGAATDIDGAYFIINVPPGDYSVRTDFVGYGVLTQTNVRVQINLTTYLNFELATEAIQGEAVSVIAQRPIVQADVSANIATLTGEDVENIPLASIEDAIDLQAGVEPGLVVRGGSTDQLAFVVDGFQMRDGRDNQAYTTVSFTAVEEFQVQTGGFSAEYGNLRSGLVNVVTKDPPKDKFFVDAMARYGPSQEMSFGDGVKGPLEYWWRPYTDPQVANAGTESGVWDTYTQRQYPVFPGWQAISDGLAGDADPTNDLSTDQLRQVFDYHHRLEKDIVIPEYEVDVTLGGPLIPGANSGLGDLRFLASYRAVQEPYFYPQVRDAYTDQQFSGKIISDLSQTMKLTLNGLFAHEKGMAYDAFETVNVPVPQRGGIPFYPWSDVSSRNIDNFGSGTVFGAASMVNDNREHVGRGMVYGSDRYSVTDVERNMVGAKLTHSLSNKTFYDVAINRFATAYDTHPNSRRDNTTVLTIGQTDLDQAPIGWTSDGITSIGSELRLGGHFARARDTSRVNAITGKFDLTSQVNSFSLLKAGVELSATDYDMTYGSDDSVIVHQERSRQKWTRNTKQAAAYVTNKFEFSGMIANVGLRMDYFDPGGDWWVFNEFEQSFSAANKDDRGQLVQAATEKQVALSPRLGVSFPITEVSKLYFNYGHSRQLLAARELFQVEQQWLGNIGRLGDPNQPFVRTVAYELGYEQSLLDDYLIRISGYYRDSDNQPRSVRYNSISGDVDYLLTSPFNYSDVRGVEFNLIKNNGKWFRGFGNFTFMQFKAGNFGFGENNENITTQREYLLTSTDHYQFRPVAQPYASVNLEFFTSPGWGPALGDIHPFEDVRLDLLTGWRSGQAFTFTGPSGGDIPGIQNNIRMRDFFNFDLRLSKNIGTSFGRLNLYADVANVLNLKYLYFIPGGGDPSYAGPFEGNRDWDDYMESLHLDPAIFADIEESEIPYDWVYGSDRPGDFRPEGVDFVPIEIAPNADAIPTPPSFVEDGRDVLLYIFDTNEYMMLQGGEWVAADESLVKQVTDDKAYIDNPNELHRSFLNPRTYRFGIRISF